MKIMAGINIYTYRLQVMTKSNIATAVACQKILSAKRASKSFPIK
jgi:hypothetical protein